MDHLLIGLMAGKPGNRNGVMQDGAIIITPAIKYLNQCHSGERQNPGKQPGCRIRHPGLDPGPV
jgi:hypothetical protein